MKDPIISDKEDIQLFFSSTLQRIYWAKKHLVELLHKMKAEVLANPLQQLIDEDLSQTAHHVQRLGQVFDELGREPEEKVCEAMQGLLKDAHYILASTRRKTRIRDMGIKASLLKVEHYELATYSILIEVSRAMGWQRIVVLLEQNRAEAMMMEAELMGPTP